MAPEHLKRLFYQMLRVRLIETCIGEFYPEQEMRCPVHLCIGQEAVAAGVCAHLGVHDWVYSGHRSHGHYLAKGGDLRAMVAEIYGKATGCCHGRGGSMHVVDLDAGFMGSTPIVASTIPIGVGAAFGSMMRGEKRLVVIFFGEGAAEEGVFHEALNFAALKKLPVLFVCENNLYSVHSPLSVRQPAGREVFWLARGHGIDSHQGDGNDVGQVYDIAERAIRKINEEGGPVFLEFKTYRYREHCGHAFDNHLGYRSDEEYLHWKQRCPLDRAWARALKEGVLTPAELDDMSASIRAEWREAVRFAKKSPFPRGETLMDFVYAGDGQKQ